MNDGVKFWLDGRFLTEYMPLNDTREDLREKFIWTDGSEMIYQNWNKKSKDRSGRYVGTPGEPQLPEGVEDHLCLHAGVEHQIVDRPAPKQQMTEDETCESWGNQESCITMLPFVCKRAWGYRSE